MRKTIGGLFLAGAMIASGLSAAAQTATSTATFSCGGSPPITIDYTHGTVTDSVLGTPIAASITASTVRWTYDVPVHEYSLKTGDQIVTHHFDYTLDLNAYALNGRTACVRQN